MYINISKNQHLQYHKWIITSTFKNIPLFLLIGNPPPKKKKNDRRTTGKSTFGPHFQALARVPSLLGWHVNVTNTSSPKKLMDQTLKRKIKFSDIIFGGGFHVNFQRSNLAEFNFTHPGIASHGQVIHYMFPLRAASSNLTSCLDEIGWNLEPVPL